MERHAISGRGRRNGWVTSALFAALLASPAPLPAFNPIHDASYNLEPAGNHSHGTHLSIAAIVDSRSTDIWTVPVSLALRVSPRVELGAGLRTAWGGGTDDHVPYLVFGAKWLARTRTSFQADILVPADADHGKGFSLGSHHRFRHASWLDSRLALRLGFMEALVEDDGLAAFEAGWYPTLMPGRALALELGFIGASQTRNFEGNLAIDLQPALLVHFGRHSTLKTAAALGLAGDRKEELRVKAQIDHGF